MEIYHYRYRGWSLAGWELRNVLRVCTGGGEEALSIEFGTRQARVTCLGERKVCIAVGGEERCLTLPIPLRVNDDAGYALVKGGLVKLAAYTPLGYIKLRPLEPGKPPTVEVNGIHMHRIEDIDPLDDARLKARAARVCRGCTVLDTCGGLGYTTLASLERGASLVVTVEIEEAILSMAEFNPWSRHLANNRVVLIHGDIRDIVKRLPSESFDRIIHDPPRISIAGELYDTALYKQFYRVLRRGGILYHYTGEPGRKRRLNIPRTVARKLEEAGFSRPRYNPLSQGVVAFKD